MRCASISFASLRAISTGWTCDEKARLNTPSTRFSIRCSRLRRTLIAVLRGWHRGRRSQAARGPAAGILESGILGAQRGRAGRERAAGRAGRGRAHEAELERHRDRARRSTTPTRAVGRGCRRRPATATPSTAAAQSIAPSSAIAAWRAVSSQPRVTDAAAKIAAPSSESRLISGPRSESAASPASAVHPAGASAAMPRSGPAPKTSEPTSEPGPGADAEHRARERRVADRAQAGGGASQGRARRRSERPRARGRQRGRRRSATGRRGPRAPARGRGRRVARRPRAASPQARTAPAMPAGRDAAIGLRLGARAERRQGAIGVELVQVRLEQPPSSSTVGRQAGSGSRQASIASISCGGRSGRLAARLGPPAPIRRAVSAGLCAGDRVLAGPALIQRSAPASRRRTRSPRAAPRPARATCRRAFRRPRRSAVSVGEPVRLAIPKSISFARRPPSWSSRTMTFWGLTSRWITPRACAWASASQTSVADLGDLAVAQRAAAVQRGQRLAGHQLVTRIALPSCSPSS